jgi:hypothetical protein
LAYLAVVQFERANALASPEFAENCKTLLAEAREIFARLGAIPWLDRVDAVSHA